jgi:hypothetical protein
VNTHAGPPGAGLKRAFLLSLLGLLALASAPAVEVTVVPVDGEEASGALTELDAQAGLRVQDRTFKLDEVAEIRFRGAPPAAPKDKVGVRLRNGDLLYALIVSGGDKGLKLQSAVLGDLEVPNDLLLGFVLPLKEPLPDETITQFFAGANPDQDQVLTPKGETLGGFLEKLTDKELAVEIGGQKRVLPLDQVAAFRYAALKPFPAPEGVQAVVRLGDGSSLSGKLQGLKEDKLLLSAAAGAKWEIPTPALRSIGFTGGKLVYLSRLEPKVEQRPLVGGAPVVFRWRKDLAANGERLKIGAREYARGLGVHSYCKLAYTLDAAYAFLMAEVGLDAGAPAGTVCAWKVVGDGKVLAEGEAKAGAEAKKLKLPLAGVKTLDLVCDYGPDRDDAGDLLDWAEARLVKE